MLALTQMVQPPDFRSQLNTICNYDALALHVRRRSPILCRFPTNSLDRVVCPRTQWQLFSMMLVILSLRHACTDHRGISPSTFRSD